MKVKQNGFILPYCLFLVIIVLNMFIFVVLCNLNTNKFYDDKINYNHLIILEERANKHIIKKIQEHSIENLETETIYYDEDWIVIYYQFNNVTGIWTVAMAIHHNSLSVNQTIEYNPVTNVLELQ